MGGHGGARRWSSALLPSDSWVFRGIVQLQTGRPLLWERPPTGASDKASDAVKALDSLNPGDRFVNNGIEIGRIGVAGLPLPDFHYHLDDDEYPARLSEHGEIYREWQIWAVMLVQSPSFRVVSADGEAIKTEVEQPHPQACSRAGDQPSVSVL